MEQRAQPTWGGRVRRCGVAGSGDGRGDELGEEGFDVLFGVFVWCLFEDGLVNCMALGCSLLVWGVVVVGFGVVLL